jgi:hypothetical protein
MLELRAHGIQGRHGLRGKATLRKLRRALHEQHHRGRIELGLDLFLEFHNAIL